MEGVPGWHLALHAGRLNSVDKMATEVSTVARSHNENDKVPMDVSLLKGKGGKGKDVESKDGKGKDRKGKAKVEDDKDKTDPKSNPNKDRKCFYCDDSRTKKKDDEERKTTLAQNSLSDGTACVRATGFPLMKKKKRSLCGPYSYRVTPIAG